MFTTHLQPVYSIIKEFGLKVALNKSIDLIKKSADLFKWIKIIFKNLSNESFENIYLKMSLDFTWIF